MFRFENSINFYIILWRRVLMEILCMSQNFLKTFNFADVQFLSPSDSQFLTYIILLE